MYVFVDSSSRRIFSVEGIGTGEGRGKTVEAKERKERRAVTSMTHGRLRAPLSVEIR